MGIVAGVKRLLKRIREEEGYDSPTGLRWIPASENPFGIRILDCSSITQSMVAMTSEVNVAITFNKLRSSQGIEYLDREPKAYRSEACELEYPPIQTLEDGPVFKAAEMEDKWDIYLFHSQLYFCRSWSGILAYRAHVHSVSDKILVTQIDYEKQRANEPMDAVKDVDYLIKSHLYGVVVPHPLLRNITNDPKQLALDSFSRFGRRCLYGSHEDTTQIKVVPGMASWDSSKQV